jgi:hypothetical protein
LIHQTAHIEKIVEMKKAPARPFVKMPAKESKVHAASCRRVIKESTEAVVSLEWYGFISELQADKIMRQIQRYARSQL